MPSSLWDTMRDDDEHDDVNTADTFNVFADGHGDDERTEHEADEESRRDAARALQARGNAHAEAGRLAEALGAWAAGLSAQPPARERARLHESRAQVRMLRGEWFAAVEEAAAAAAAQPAWPAAHATLGRAQLNLGEPSLAVRTLQTALARLVAFAADADDDDDAGVTRAELEADLAYAQAQARAAQQMRAAADPRAVCWTGREGEVPVLAPAPKDTAP